LTTAVGLASAGASSTSAGFPGRTEEAVIARVTLVRWCFYTRIIVFITGPNVTLVTLTTAVGLASAGASSTSAGFPGCTEEAIVALSAFRLGNFDTNTSRAISVITLVGTT